MDRFYWILLNFIGPIFYLLIIYLFLFFFENYQFEKNIRTILIRVFSVHSIKIFIFFSVFVSFDVFCNFLKKLGTTHYVHFKPSLVINYHVFFFSKLLFSNVLLKKKKYVNKYSKHISLVGISRLA